MMRALTSAFAAAALNVLVAQSIDPPQAVDRTTTFQARMTPAQREHGREHAKNDIIGARGLAQHGLTPRRILDEGTSIDLAIDLIGVEATMTVRQMLTATACGNAIVFEGRAVGSVGLVPKTDIFRCTMELGYWIGEPFWGRGFASEAVRALVRWAFATYSEITAIQARHFASNPGSGRVLTSCGFQVDGRLRDAAIKGGIIHDVLVYSRTRRDEEHAGR